MGLFHNSKSTIYYVQDALFLGSYVPPSTGEVRAHRTPISRNQVKSLLSSALKITLGRNPNVNEIKMITAQSDLETRGWAAMWNNNFGNSIAKKAPWFQIPGDTSHKYKSFPSPSSGALYYVNMLKTRFSEAWKHLGSGNPKIFAQALKNQNYYEASVDSYSQGLEDRYRKA